MAQLKSKKGFNKEVLEALTCCFKNKKKRELGGMRLFIIRRGILRISISI